MKKWLICVLAALLAASASACSLMRFTTTEEQRQKEESARKLAQAAEYVSPQDALLGSLTYERRLVNAEGSELARYFASVPQFSEEGARSQIFERINDFYEAEYSAFEGDCAVFFDFVKKSYGDGDEWASISVPSAPARSRFDYQILSGPENYISVERTYVNENGGKREVYYYSDVFLADSGWRIGLNDIFGENTDKAYELIRKELTDWCLGRNIPTDRAAAINVENFKRSFSIDSSFVTIYTEPFTFSLDDGESHVIQIPISVFEGLFAEQLR